MEEKNKNDNTSGIKVIIFIIVIVISVVLAVFDKDDKKDNTSESNNTTAAISNQTIETETKVDPTTLNDTDYIKYCITSKIGDKTNEKKDKIVSIVNDNKDYTIVLNAEDNLTNNLIKNAILGEIKKFYIEFTKESNRIDNVSSITTIYNFPLKDSYGNTSDKQIFKIIFDSNTIKKTNWNDILTTNLTTIANDYWISSALEK